MLVVDREESCVRMEISPDQPADGPLRSAIVKRARREAGDVQWV